MADSLARISREVVRCERCPRLRRWCREVARTKVKRFRDQEYWGRPIPGFGDPRARLLVVGLAPAAHGGNRTGRVFTGDRSGDFLFAALHRAGFASQPESVGRQDGLRLRDCYITPVARCAPPGNKPTPAEIARCTEYLAREWALLGDLRAVLVLGRIAMDGFLAMLRERSHPLPRGIAFAHGAVHDLGGGVRLVCSYHVSQQNTFTGQLTPRSFDAVLRRVRSHLKRLPSLHGHDRTLVLSPRTQIECLAPKRETPTRAPARAHPRDHESDEQDLADLGGAWNPRGHSTWAAAQGARRSGG